MYLSSGCCPAHLPDTEGSPEGEPNVGLWAALLLERGRSTHSEVTYRETESAGSFKEQGSQAVVTVLKPQHPRRDWGRRMLSWGPAGHIVKSCLKKCKWESRGTAWGLQQEAGCLEPRKGTEEAHGDLGLLVFRVFPMTCWAHSQLWMAGSGSCRLGCQDAWPTGYWLV
jgi:hypothetical protein